MGSLSKFCVRVPAKTASNAADRVITAYNSLCIMDDRLERLAEKAKTLPKAPGVYVTREPRTKGVTLYGPFTSVYQLKEAVTLLQKAFQFRTCHLDIKDGDDTRKFFRPCLLYAIGQCTAPCAAKISKDNYAEDV